MKPRLPDRHRGHFTQGEGRDLGCGTGVFGGTVTLALECPAPAAPDGTVASAPEGSGTAFAFFLGRGDVAWIREGPASGCCSLSFGGAGPDSFPSPPTMSLAFPFPLFAFSSFTTKALSALR